MLIIESVFKEFGQDLVEIKNSGFGFQTKKELRIKAYTKFRKAVFKTIVNSGIWPDYDKKETPAQWLVVNQCEKKIAEILGIGEGAQ